MDGMSENGISSDKNLDQNYWKYSFLEAFNEDAS